MTTNGVPFLAKPDRHGGYAHDMLRKSPDARNGGRGTNRIVMGLNMWTHPGRFVAIGGRIGVLLTAGLGFQGRSATDEGLRGTARGCLRGVFTRSATLTERVRRIEPIGQEDDFSFRFRFRTEGKGTYGAVVYVGVRDESGDFKTNGAGVRVFRHSKTYGLVGGAFVADSGGEIRLNRDGLVALQYGEVYDVSCAYSAADRSLRVGFGLAGTGEPVGRTDVLQVPADSAWSADRFGCWNHADGHPVRGRLTVLIDRLGYGSDRAHTFDEDLLELPDGDGEHFSWYAPPVPPLLAALRGPTEIPRGGCVFSAGVGRADVQAIAFRLRTPAGKVVWKALGPVADGEVKAVLPAAVAAELEPGPYILSAGTGDLEDGALYKGVQVRGRVFRDMLETPPDMVPGDELVITDMSLFGPPEAISRKSTRGKWWRRKYTQDGDSERRALLCVEEHDLETPASCLAPSLVLPLRLEGWYEIWVTTLRHREGGGIDVRLSGEPYFVHADPQQVSGGKRKDAPAYGSLVDVRYRAADLGGRELVFQQPYGTYESVDKLCNASLAGVRLVRLSPKQVETLRAERSRPETKVTGFDNDGFSYFFKWGVQDVSCIARLVEPLRDTSARFFNLELGGLGGITIPTPYTGMYQMTGHTRDGDSRANAFFRWCFENEVNLVDVLTDRAHAIGLQLFVSLMMERSFSRDETMRKHPEWRIEKGRGTWDYAKAEVREFQVNKIAWIMTNHDIDGFIVDFTRYGHYFNEDEPNAFAHMNAFVRELRQATDRVNAGKQRKVRLCASYGERSWHLLHWGTGKLEDQGLDIET